VPRFSCLAKIRELCYAFSMDLMSSLDLPNEIQKSVILGGNVSFLLLFYVFETESFCGTQAGLTLMILLPLPPKCWDYRCVPLSLVMFVSLNIKPIHAHCVKFKSEEHSSSEVKVSCYPITRENYFQYTDIFRYF
jgi:alanine-alpha-ketoisovalerate/valine-pyruvate aminotransferase